MNRPISFVYSKVGSGYSRLVVAHSMYRKATLKFLNSRACSLALILLVLGYVTTCYWHTSLGGKFIVQQNHMGGGAWAPDTLVLYH